jgi:hypothetical protein
MTVADDARHAVVGWYRILNVPEPGPDRIRLRGLDPALLYRVTPWPPAGAAAEAYEALVRGGDDLMGAGIIVASDRRDTAARGDFQARLFVLEAAGAPTRD